MQTQVREHQSAAISPLNLKAPVRPTRHADVDAPKKAVSVGTARVMLSIGNTTVYKLLKDGTLKSIKIGSRRLVLMESIEALLAGEKAA